MKESRIQGKINITIKYFDSYMKIDHRNISGIQDKTAGLLGRGGAVSKGLKDYEFRPQQLEMAKAIAGSIEANTHLIVEAGTGTGKSLAYLMPLIIYAVENDKKVIVSTNTKTLQGQLFLKDLPFLRKALGIEFSYSLCLGSENYLCLRRLSSGYTYDLLDSDKQRAETKKIIEWSRRTRSGIKSNLGFIPSSGVWENVCRDPDLCIGKKCPHRSDCFYRRAKNHEAASDILVANHALFFTNLASGGQVLPNFDAVVFDEAQALEDVATSYLGFEISNTGIRYLLDSIYNPKRQRGLLIRLTSLSGRTADKVKSGLLASRAAADKLFHEIALKFGEESDAKRMREKNTAPHYMEGPLKSLADSLSELLNYINSDEDEALVKLYSKRCLEASNTLSVILNHSKDDYVYWIEISKRKRGTRYSLFAAPIEIAEEMRKQLFSRVSPVILTSATLSTEGNFEFIKQRLGIKAAGELLLDSPFDYEKNTLLYLPKGIESPSEDFEMFQRHALRRIKEIIDIMKGRTFALFTNYRMLNMVYNGLSDNYKYINLLKQGDRPRYDLLEDFKNNENSILLGTTTFWQGVDVPGRSLECVIITKLPFAVPDDPITEARMELIELRGQKPFLEYQVPQAIMMFKQGFGRLIRRKTDRGVVAVLDPRIKTKYYGRSFISALPKCGHTSNINDVGDFLKAGQPSPLCEEALIKG